MSTAKKLGIWMDHQHAHVIQFTGDPMVTTTIFSKSTHEAKASSLHHGENKMQSKEQHQQAEYYKTLGNIIGDYTSVVLFGPTDAKTELLHTLTADQHFSKIKIEVKQADKMTEPQEHAFVKEFFSTSKAI